LRPGWPPPTFERSRTGGYDQRARLADGLGVSLIVAHTVLRVAGGRMLPTTPVAITTLGDDGADSAGPAVTEEPDKRLRRKGQRPWASWLPAERLFFLMDREGEKGAIPPPPRSRSWAFSGCGGGPPPF